MRAIFWGLYCASSFLVILFSCKKIVENYPLHVAVNDSAWLKMVVIDTTFSPGLDTVEKRVISYDILHRLKRTDDYHYQPGSQGVTYTFFEERFYHQADPVPFKIIFQYAGVTIDTTFIWYSEGRVIKDSTCFGSPLSGPKTQYFTYITSDLIMKTENYFNLSGTLTYSDSILLSRIWLDGSHLFGSDSLFTSAHSSLRGLYYLEFDRRPNPMKIFQIGYPLDIVETVSEPGIMSMGDNYFYNMTRKIILIPYPASYTITYSYLEDGYPLTKVSTEEPNWKTIFIYGPL